ncbi:MAG TPA: MlaD family protein [Marmoricola sp.]|nr:MlaD family protein [Marmoricola sp.]
MNSLSHTMKSTRWQLLGIAAFTALTLIATGMVLGTIRAGSLGHTHQYSAVFSDIAGLKKGADVRIAGVRVGRVTGFELTGEKARVDFEVSSQQTVGPDSIASINFLNLMGQKYLGLSNPPGAASSRLPEGSTIPITRTRAPLDLTELFNSFKPIFELIKPADVNTLLANVVGVLQGEGPTITSLTQQTASLTTTLVERDEVIGRVIDNLNSVLGSVNANQDTLTEMITSLDTLTRGVAADKEVLIGGFDNLHRLSTQTSAILDESVPTINRNVRSLNSFEGSFEQRKDQVVAGITDAQGILETYLKSLGVGSFLNVYVCQAYLTIVGMLDKQSLSMSDQNSSRCR